MRKVAFLFPDWMREALCAAEGRDVPDERFFSEVNSDEGMSADILSAKAVCIRCPVRRQCLEFAFEMESSRFRQGIYGGTTGEQRELAAGIPDRVDTLLEAMELEAEELKITPVRMKLVASSRKGRNRERTAAYR